MSKQQVALASRSFLVAVIIVVVVVAVVVVVDGYLFFLFPPAFNFDFDLISINYTRYELAHSALFIVPSYHQSVRRRRKKKKPPVRTDSNPNLHYMQLSFHPFMFICVAPL